MSKAIYTRKLGRSVASLARPQGTYTYYVLEENSKWSVVSEGSVKALRVFLTREQALKFAQEKALHNAAEVVVHEKNGQIEKPLRLARV